jgi:hypothetical protein
VQEWRKGVVNTQLSRRGVLHEELHELQTGNDVRGQAMVI